MQTLFTTNVVYTYAQCAKFVCFLTEKFENRNRVQITYHLLK